MANRTVIPAPIKGLDTDQQPQGTAHRCMDLIPWRGGLRKRGRITALSYTNVFGGGDTVQCVGEFGTNGWVVDHAGDSGVDGGGSFHFDTALSTSTQVAAADFDLTDTYDTDLQVCRWIRAGDDLIGIREQGVHTIDQCGLLRWGGASTYTANPSGTASLTIGSQKVTGTTTAFLTECEVGAFICVNPAASSAGRKYHRISAIVSDTVMYIDTKSEATVSSGTYTISSVVPLFVNPPTAVSTPLFGVGWTTGTTTVGRNVYSNTINTRAAAFHQGRLFVANFVEARQRDTSQASPLAVRKQYRLRWSGLYGETNADTSIISTSGCYKGIENFDSTALLDLGAEGGDITGLASWNDALVVLRQRAVQIITGGFATDGTDLGATVQTVATNAGAWCTDAWDVGEEGVYFCDGGGAYLWDGRQVRNLVRGRISQFWDVQYQASSGSAPRYVSCLRERVVFSPGEDNPTEWLSYWPGYDAWFEFQCDDTYFRGGRVTRNYLDNELIIENGSINIAKMFNFGTMMEWRSTSNDHLGYDQNGAADGLYPAPSLTMNPIPIGDGIMGGRVLEVQVNQSGKQDTYANGSEGSVLLELFDAPAYEASIIGSSIGSSYLKFPDPNDASTNEASRSASQNPNSNRTQTHLMVRLTASGGVPATITDKKFTYTLWGVGVDFEIDESKYAD